jgi:PRTRC genetic system protein F
LTLEKLKKISQASNDAVCRSLAQQVLKLRAAVKAANKVDARLPDVSGLNVHTIEPGCSLIYQFDQRVYAVFDDQYNCAMQEGNAADIFGLDELPTKPTELKAYFERMKLALVVLNEMDHLISMIAKPHYMEA